MANCTKQYLKYDPCELVCHSHNVKFVKFDCGDRIGVKRLRYKYGCNVYRDSEGRLYVKFVQFVKGLRYKLYSHGCPVCVGLIRAKVQMEISRGTKIGSNGRRIRTSLIRTYDRRKVLTEIERVGIIKAMNDGGKRNDVAKRYNIKISTVDRIRRSERQKYARRKKAEFAKGIAATRVAVEAT